MIRQCERCGSTLTKRVTVHPIIGFTITWCSVGYPRAGERSPHVAGVRRIHDSAQCDARAAVKSAALN